MLKHAMYPQNILVHWKFGKSNGSVGLIIKICKILKVSPNYIFEDLYDNQDSQPSSLSSDMLIKYLKLSQDNKKFIDNIVDYIYNIQKCK